MALTMTVQTAYAELLTRTLPRVIKSEKENEASIAELERLDMLDRPLTAAEKLYAELMTVLVQRFEQEHYPMEHASPLDALKSLMEERTLRQADLLPVFGSRSVASDVLNGKRGLSKAHARGLADFFHVSPSLFI
jgi:HTH-type transcriptional regulator / antitoxin HigA